MKRRQFGWLGCALLVLACNADDQTPTDAGVRRHDGNMRDAGSQPPSETDADAEVAVADADAEVSDHADAGGEAPDDASSPAPDAASGSGDAGAPSATRDASLAPLGDAGDDASADGDIPPLPKTVLPCREQHPDYDCQTSQSVYLNSELRDLLGAYCTNCHNSGPTHAFPPLLRESPLGHDAVMMYTDLDNPDQSPLVALAGDGHGCEDNCARVEIDISQALSAWQSEIGQRKTRLEKLAVAWQRWIEQGITSYQWHVRSDCFGCSTQRADNVLAAVNGETVEALMIGEVYVSQSPATPAPVSLAQSWHTVDGLFDWIQQAILEDPDILNITYDERLHYPIRVYIDYHRDWYDEQDDFSADGLTPLDGYCVAAGPFGLTETESELPRCGSTADCAGCSPTTTTNIPCTGGAECLEDSDCSSGRVCVAVEQGCVVDYSRVCQLACSAESCDAGYVCQADGHCTPRSCADDASLCFTPAHCQPQAAAADAFGCLPPTCEETDVECAAFETCDPQAPGARPNGCAAKACAADQDCGCGSCVNDRCSATPGVCH